MDDGKILICVNPQYHALERDTLEIPARKTGCAGRAWRLNALPENWRRETVIVQRILNGLITLRTTVAFCDKERLIFTLRNLIPSPSILKTDEFINVETYTIDELKKKFSEIEDSKRWQHFYNICGQIQK